jgi:hypothetical protein
VRHAVADVGALMGIGLALAVSFALAALTGVVGRRLLDLLGLTSTSEARIVLAVGSVVVGLAANWLVVAWCLAHLPRPARPLRPVLPAAAVAAVGLVGGDGAGRAGRRPADRLSRRPLAVPGHGVDRHASTGIGHGSQPGRPRGARTRRRHHRMSSAPEELLVPRLPDQRATPSR